MKRFFLLCFVLVLLVSACGLEEKPAMTQVVIDLEASFHSLITYQTTYNEFIENTKDLRAEAFTVVDPHEIAMVFRNEQNKLVSYSFVELANMYETQRQEVYDAYYEKDLRSIATYELSLSEPIIESDGMYLYGKKKVIYSDQTSQERYYRYEFSRGEKNPVLTEIISFYGYANFLASLEEDVIFEPVN